MSDIVDKLRDWSYVPSSKEQKEVADEVESLRAENAALMETITSQDTLIISLKEERDRLVALDKESKAALDKFNRQLMRDNAILGARVGELTKQLSVNQGQNVKLKESIVQKNSDISSLVERDFANQRKIAYLMQRVGKTETDNL
jgi:chromosome segregation ATPase